jgi:hypothetical protein
LLAIGVTSCQPGNHGPYLSIARLKQIADDVPIPLGVTLVSEQSGTSFNGTTGVHSNQDIRRYQTALSCARLVADWLVLLHQQDRSWTLANPPPPEDHRLYIHDPSSTINVDLGAGTYQHCGPFTMVVSDLKHG